MEFFVFDPMYGPAVMERFAPLGVHLWRRLQTMNAGGQPAFID
jgi:hypothetical protein